MLLVADNLLFSEIGQLQSVNPNQQTAIFKREKLT